MEKLSLSSTLKSGGENPMVIPIVGAGTVQEPRTYDTVALGTPVDEGGYGTSKRRRHSYQFRPEMLLPDADDKPDPEVEYELGCQSTDVIATAISVGIRRLDTAFAYYDERAVGNIVRQHSILFGYTREQFFITAKLPYTGMTKERVGFFLQRSLQRLGLRYVDLYMIQNPVGFKYDGPMYPRKLDYSIDIDMTTDHAAVWEGMEDQVREGRAKHIGVCDFTVAQLDRLWKHAKIKPACIQGECHLYFTNRELRRWAAEHGVVFAAYACLGSPTLQRPLVEAKTMRPEAYNPPYRNDVIMQLATKYNKTVTQIQFRHILQLGVAAIPKFSNNETVQECANVFDFELSDEDMETLAALDKGEVGRKYSLVGYFKGYEKHPENPYPVPEHDFLRPTTPPLKPDSPSTSGTRQ